jgi:hypothetical protein
MSAVVKHIPYQNRLAKLVRKPGGKRIAEALEDAEANIAALRDEGLEELDRMIAAIFRAGRGDLTPEAIEAIYVDANQIVGLAGVFGHAAVGSAAFSLCDLLDRCGHERCDRQAVQVHADTLMLLRNEALSPDQSQVLLEGLKQVAARAVAAAAARPA